HGVAAVFVLDVVARHRDLAQFEEKEAGKRLESSVTGQLDSVFVLQLTDARGSIELDLGVLGLNTVDLLIVLVFDASYNLREHVIDGDHSHDRSELVDYH